MIVMYILIAIVLWFVLGFGAAKLHYTYVKTTEYERKSVKEEFFLLIWGPVSLLIMGVLYLYVLYKRKP